MLLPPGTPGGHVPGQHPPSPGLRPREHRQCSWLSQLIMELAGETRWALTARCNQLWLTTPPCSLAKYLDSHGARVLQMHRLSSERAFALSEAEGT